jgi:hypothetical protein
MHVRTYVCVYIRVYVCNVAFYNTLGQALELLNPKLSRGGGASEMLQHRATTHLHPALHMKTDPAVPMLCIALSMDSGTLMQLSITVKRKVVTVHAIKSC